MSYVCLLSSTGFCQKGPVRGYFSVLTGSFGFGVVIGCSVKAFKRRVHVAAF